MTKTLQEALSPLLIISSFCGLSVLEYPFGRPRLHFSYLYTLILLSIYTYLFYYLSYISHTTNIFMTPANIITLLTEILSIPINLFYFKKLKTCLYDISIVDDTLEAFGTLKEYQRLYNWTIRIIIGWIVTVCLMGTLDSVWINYVYLSVVRIFVPFVVNYPLHINTLNCLICGIILGYMSSRYQQINEHIHNILKLEHIERRNKLMQPRLKTNKCLLYMWTIMHIHQQLCVILRKLNEVYGIPMTLQMASSFLFFVDMSCLVYTAYVNSDTATFAQVLDSKFVFIWAILFNTKLLMLNLICQTIYDKIDKTVAILYKLSHSSLDEDLREQVLYFILQIKQRNLRFFGMGLFHFGCDFIRQFYASVATMVIIIIQMHITYKNMYVTPSTRDDILANA